MRDEKSYDNKGFLVVLCIMSHKLMFQWYCITGIFLVCRYENSMWFATYIVTIRTLFKAHVLIFPISVIGIKDPGS